MLKAAMFALATLAICRGASLDGLVTSTTGEPLKNASVQLLAQTPVIRPPYTPQRPPDRDSYTVLSDATGRFAFDSLPAGQYSVSAKRTGYFPYSGPLLTIDPAQSAAPLSIRLTPFSRIEGKVTGEDGEPLSGSVIFPGWSASASSTPVAPDGTFVSAVGAGHFYVRASIGLYAGPDEDIQGAWPREVYVPTYYPSSTTLSGATMLNVPAGAVIRGVDIRVRRVTVYTVRGHAIDASTGKPAGGLRIVLQADGGLGPGLSAFTEVAADGSFELKDVQPATYAVSAFNPKQRPNPNGQPPSRLFSLQPVTVGKENVEDLTVTLRPGAVISGTIRMDAGESLPSSGPGIGVGLVTPGGSGSGGRAQPDGSFVIQDIPPGKYVLRVDTLPAGAYVKSMRLNRQEIEDQETVDLTSGAGGTMDVVLSAHAAEIDGTVRDASGTPVPQVRVLVWKPGRTTGGSAVRPEEFATTDLNGGFRARGLAPGEYRVAAWAAAVVPYVPEFLSQFDGMAATVKLEEDAHATVDAPLIPQDAIDHAAENIRVSQ